MVQVVQEVITTLMRGSLKNPEAMNSSSFLCKQKKEQQLTDPLRGLRVHCWVLVLSGSRSVQENFFIDPLTGISFPTSSDSFLGIESVWNNLNYYVNMQDCSNGCAVSPHGRVRVSTGRAGPV